MMKKMKKNRVVVFLKLSIEKENPLVYNWKMKDLEGKKIAKILKKIKNTLSVKYIIDSTFS